MPPTSQDRPAKGRDRRFTDTLTERLRARRHERVARRIDWLWANEPGDDRPDSEWLAWHRQVDSALNTGHRLNIVRRESLEIRYGTAPRPRRRIFPRARRREHRPGAKRRASSSSRTSSADPGASDSDALGEAGLALSGAVA